MMKLESSGNFFRALNKIFKKSLKPYGHNWKSLRDRDQLMIWREFKVHYQIVNDFLHCFFSFLFTDEICFIL